MRIHLCRITTVAAAAAIVLAMSPSRAVSANLVVNGGFETGDLTGWTVSPSLIFSGVACPGAGVAPEGICEGYFGPIGAVGTLSQTLSTQAGSNYVVSFMLEGDGSTPGSFAARWGTQTLYGSTNLTAGPFVSLAFNVTASAAATTLAFDFRSDNGFVYLDNVSVAAPVPEPGSAALTLLGLSMLGWRLRRKADWV